MFNVINKYKSQYMFFAGIKPDGDHYVYLSAYGPLATALLERYIGDQRDDNEDLFDEWDKSVEKAASQVGFSTNHAVEDGHIYINSFQNGIGAGEEQEPKIKRRTSHLRNVEKQSSPEQSDTSEEN